MPTKDRKHALAEQNIQQWAVEESWWRAGAGAAKKKKAYLVELSN